jgi:hypothetical protein
MRIDAVMILIFTTIGIMAVSLAAIVYLEMRKRKSSVKSLVDSPVDPPKEETSADIVARIARGQDEIRRTNKRKQIEDAIAKTRSNGAYDTTEHLTSELDLWKKK